MESILISACLLGICCRYDGRSKQGISEELLEKLKARYNLVPVCPEIYGGLPTPRMSSERVGDRVLMADGTDMTENYRRGAEATLALARLLGSGYAILKERSPSCGHGEIHDGTFTGALTDGDGVTAELLLKNGITVVGESRVRELLLGG